MVGGDGDDQLFGGDDSDSFDGGNGDDFIDGGAGVDTLTYATASAGVTVSLSVTGPQNTGGAGVDTLTRIESVYGSNYADVLTGDWLNNDLLGNDGADVLIGGGGMDNLYGAAGDDRIEGQGGSDTLSGGTGNDLFVFAAGSNQDRIADFVAGGTEDTLDFSAYEGSGYTYSVAQNGADTVFTFTNGDVVILTGVTATDLVQIDAWHWG
ncbi:hypothetical protein H8B08_08145 [Caulobacter sp. 17J80-11]|nr:hypothetical protein [Caulobacter sp. 17J80-11]